MIIPFPLYHGTSSHYLASFQEGRMPDTPWPHLDEAKRFLHTVWDELKRSGQKPGGLTKNILQQNSGYSNWQHGEIYVSPSELSAVRYATDGAAYGGELLTECKNSLDILRRVTPTLAEHFLSEFPSVKNILKGGGAPILIKITNVEVQDLSTENSNDSVESTIEEIELCSGEIRDVVCQQHNFRLKFGCGSVDSIFRVERTDPDCPTSSFSKMEISQ